jgi:hypothetical protein
MATWAAIQLTARTPPARTVVGGALTIYVGAVYLPDLINGIEQFSGSFIDRLQQLAADLKKCEAITDDKKRAQCVKDAWNRFKGIGKPN